MRARSLRWLVFLGCAAVAFGVLGVTVTQAQAVKIPDDKLPDGVKNAGEFAPPGYDGSGTHPGKNDFETYCSGCHSLNTTGDGKAGPGLQGIYDRVTKGPKYKDWPVQKRMLEYIKHVVTGGPLSEDPYFADVQKKHGTTPGVDMQSYGGFNINKVTDREILNVIDYILRYTTPTFDEAEYLKQVKLGRELVSGARDFTYGGPSCTGCHTIGADHDLRGANIAGNIADTYVLARRRGSNEKINYADGLQDILSGDDAPAAHYWYKDVEGVTPRRPLTEKELVAVNTFFEQAARETGTEQDSNYLPIFALLAAALGILLLEPGVLNILFVKEDHEYIDGPYAEEEHHHGGDHAEHAEEKTEGKSAEKAEDKKEESAEKPEDATKAEEPAAEEKAEKPADEAKEEAAEDKAEESADEKAEEKAEAPAEDAGEEKSEDKGDAESDDSDDEKK